MCRSYIGTYYGNIMKNGCIQIPAPLAAIIKGNDLPDKFCVFSVKLTCCFVSVIQLYNAVSDSGPEIDKIIADISFTDIMQIVRNPQVESAEYCGMVQMSKKHKLRVPPRALSLAGLSDEDEIAILGQLNYIEIWRRDLWIEQKERAAKLWEKHPNISFL